MMVKVLLKCVCCGKIEAIEASMYANLAFLRYQCEACVKAECYLHDTCNLERINKT